MRTSALTGAAAAVAALAVVLSGCGSDTKTATSSSSIVERDGGHQDDRDHPAPVAGPEPDDRRLHPGERHPGDRDQEGDPNAPAVNLPVPDGWEPGSEKTPDNAYGAIVYTGRDADRPAEDHRAVRKLTGNVDPQKILELAPGELNNLPGYKPGNEGETSTLGDYPAYQLGGAYTPTADPLIAQKTVVIPAADGLYVLQLNAYATRQADIPGAARI